MAKDSACRRAVVAVPSGARDRERDCNSPSFGTIRQTVREAAGIDCRVELVSRRIGLPLTSSGKLSRSHARARLLTGAYDRTSPLHPA